MPQSPGSTSFVRPSSSAASSASPASTQRSTRTSPGAEAGRRTDDLLEQFALGEAADRVVKTYSGGMRRRLDRASALIGRPRLLFLDEPTTGLDPRGRLGMWEVIRALVRLGTTLLLNTHYLEEADELAHTIAVVDHGKIIAGGTSDELKSTTPAQLDHCQ